jgi:hypothetical protein
MLAEMCATRTLVVAGMKWYEKGAMELKPAG